MGGDGFFYLHAQALRTRRPAANDADAGVRRPAGAAPISAGMICPDATLARAAGDQSADCRACVELGHLWHGLSVSAGRAEGIRPGAGAGDRGGADRVWRSSQSIIGSPTLPTSAWAGRGGSVSYRVFAHPDSDPPLPNRPRRGSVGAGLDRTGSSPMRVQTHPYQVMPGPGRLRVDPKGRPYISTE